MNLALERCRVSNQQEADSLLLSVQELLKIIGNIQKTIRNHYDNT